MTLHGILCLTGLAIIAGSVLVCCAHKKLRSKDMREYLTAIVLALVLCGSAGAAQRDLLYFGIDGCQPCLAMRPIVDRLQGVTVTEVDGTAEPGLVTKYAVTAYPTFIAVDENGDEVGRIVGATTPAKLVKLVADPDLPFAQGAAVTAPIAVAPVVPAVAPVAPVPVFPRPLYPRMIYGYGPDGRVYGVPATRRQARWYWWRGYPVTRP